MACKRFYTYDKVFQNILTSTAKDANISVDDVIDIYEGIFTHIKTKLDEADVLSLDSVEELKEAKTTFIIPKLGKIYADDYAFTRNKKEREDRLNNKILEDGE